MKPWCVIRVNFQVATNLRFGHPKRGTLETGVLWAEPQATTDPYNEGATSNKQMVTHFDIEDDAKAYASLMAGQNPQYHYVTAKCSDVYKSSPGPVTRSQYTKDGLIPL